MIEDAEASCLPRPGSRLIESSSGNLGIALALVAAENGCTFICVTAANTSPQSLDVMRAPGAQTIQIDRRDASRRLPGGAGSPTSSSASPQSRTWSGSTSTPTGQPRRARPPHRSGDHRRGPGRGLPPCGHRHLRDADGGRQPLPPCLSPPRPGSWPWTRRARSASARRRRAGRAAVADEPLFDLAFNHRTTRSRRGGLLLSAVTGYARHRSPAPAGRASVRVPCVEEREVRE